MKHIKELRINAGYKTVSTAAKLLEISSSMLYHIEEGVKMPSVKVAGRMRTLYNCTFDDIFLPYITTDSNNEDSSN